MLEQYSYHLASGIVTLLDPSDKENPVITVNSDSIVTLPPDTFFNSQYLMAAKKGLEASVFKKLDLDAEKIKVLDISITGLVYLNTTDEESFWGKEDKELPEAVNDN